MLQRVDFCGMSDSAVVISLEISKGAIYGCVMDGGLCDHYGPPVHSGWQ